MLICNGGDLLTESTGSLLLIILELKSVGNVGHLHVKLGFFFGELGVGILVSQQKIENFTTNFLELFPGLLPHILELVLGDLFQTGQAFLLAIAL